MHRLNFDKDEAWMLTSSSSMQLFLKRQRVRLPRVTLTKKQIGQSLLFNLGCPLPVTLMSVGCADMEMAGARTLELVAASVMGNADSTSSESPSSTGW